MLNATDLASRAEVVVVAGTTDLVYDDLRNAVQAVLRGADLLATARDPTYPQPDGLWPGTGAILAAVEYATGRTAEIVGKPEPQLFLTALDRLGEGRTLVVGDRVGSDLAAAAAAGLDAALVLSGGSDRDELDGFEPQPVAWRDAGASCWSRRCVARARSRRPPDPPHATASAPPPRTSTPSSAHASGVTVSPAARRPRQRLGRVDAARLVQVGRADGRHEVRVAVAVQRDRAARPCSSRRSSGSSSSSASAPVLGARDRHVVPVEPGLLVGGEVVAGAHHRDHQPHPAAAQVLDLRRPPVGAVVAPPSPRPLQRAQLARARPPDPPRLRARQLHVELSRRRGVRPSPR